MNVAFIKDSEGIRPEHQNQAPLLEEENCFPGGGACEAARLYEDGSYYLYAPQHNAWAFLTTVKPKGLDQLADVFAETVKLDAPAPTLGNTGHTFTLRFRSEKNEREIAFDGVEFGDYQRLGEVRSIINANLTPIGAPGN